MAGTLEELWLSYNQITSLDGLSGLQQLTTLYISNNLVKSWNELDKLVSLLLLLLLLCFSFCRNKLDNSRCLESMSDFISLQCSRCRLHCLLPRSEGRQSQSQSRLQWNAVYYPKHCCVLLFPVLSLLSPAETPSICYIHRMVW